MTTATGIRITVIGTPKPKGSLKHIGRGRLVEQVTGSTPWRQTVAWAARSQHHGDPIADPAVVLFEVRVALPKSAPKRRIIWPATRSSGDIDKHARNILDALVDGGILADDSRVVDLRGRKRHCLPGEQPGAVICVRPATDTDLTGDLS
ncbi:RusA family crossover junction endodeoxyribonuclease [Micromonospora sp. NPDC048986]|uniref:RusA family crossover junction endodeoxyribonuclease n=1 Tax=Micromonospora sp. NPDC048986 TaxID=3155644 RepID=UPI0033D288B6